MIGPKRAHYILELRQEYLEKMESLSERHQSIDGKKDGYFQSIEQLQDIGMKLKDCHTFLKKNVTLLAGLEQK